MEPVLSFDVSNQHITRTDSFHVVAKSRKYQLRRDYAERNHKN